VALVLEVALESGGWEGGLDCLAKLCLSGNQRCVRHEHMHLPSLACPVSVNIGGLWTLCASSVAIHHFNQVLEALRDDTSTEHFGVVHKVGASWG
jgi:hypothetical protein